VKPGNHIQLGKDGESKAKSWLEEKGFRLIAENYRCPLGEIDLICQDKDFFVFIEVKTRKSLNFGDGAESVDFRKQARIQKAAQYFMKSKKLHDRPFRFDVISILLGKSETINHIVSAFP